MPLALNLFLLAIFTVARAAPAGPGLLEQAIEDWLGERDHWSFTQRAVEYGGGHTRERLERYDPSRPGDERWTLLAIDGRVPTEEQRNAWARKKFKKNRRQFDTPIGDFFDLARARIVSDRPEHVRYEVPLRREKNWLFQTDKVRVQVTLNKQSRALEHLSADIREPLKVLLGLARVTDGKLDLSFLHFDTNTEPGPESTQPSGIAQMSVTKFGERVEFTWFDFKRVTPHPSVTDGRLTRQP